MRKIWFGIALLMVIVGGRCYASEILLEQRPGDTLSGLYTVYAPDQLAVRGRNVATISGSLRALCFYGPKISPSEHMNTDNGRFFMISEAANSPLYVSGEFGSDIDPNYRWLVWNQSGRLVSGPVFSRSILMLSSCGRYLYSTNSKGSRLNRPFVYNSAGDLVLALENQSRDWDLKMAPYGELLYRDGHTVTLFRLPEFDSLQQWEIPDFAAPAKVVSTISVDGSVYAFATMSGIVALGLVTGSSSIIPVTNTDSVAQLPCPILSPSGAFLGVYSEMGAVRSISIYRRQGLSYRLRGPVVNLPMDTGYSLDPRRSYFFGHFLVCNYVNRTGYSLKHKAVLIYMSIDYSLQPDVFSIEGVVQPTERDGIFLTTRLTAGQAIIDTVVVQRE